MSHVFQIPDDIYTDLAAYAVQHGQNPDALLKQAGFVQLPVGGRVMQDSVRTGNH